MERNALVDAVGFIIGFPLAPLLAVLLRQSRSPANRKWLAPVLVAVGCSWFLQIIYRSRVELPMNMKIAAAKGDLMYDGVGGNVAILLMGWFFPLLGCLVVAGVHKIIVCIRNRKNED